MSDIPRWERRRMTCPEGEGTASLFVEWRLEDGKPVIKSISCDNPKLAGLDNWDCKWSCMTKLADKIEEEEA